MQGVDGFFVADLDKLLSKQASGRCDVTQC